jgi:CRP-like cAMP-binding protein
MHALGRFGGGCRLVAFAQSRINPGLRMHQSLPAALQTLIQCSPLRVLAKGDSLVRPGAVCSQVWVLEHGLLRTYSLGADGGEFNHDFLGPRAWAWARLELRASDRTAALPSEGRLDLMPDGTQAPSNARLCCAESALGIEALMPTAVRVLEVAKLDALRRSDAASGTYLMDRLMWASSQRLGREAALVQLSPAERYRSLIEAQPTLESAVSQKQIAAWLGITPVALSRIRRRLVSA